jgi:undecaprenyl diphosphate synthase
MEVPAVGARTFRRLPRHVGFIPDGNRRWAVGNGRSKEGGYLAGLPPAYHLFNICVELGIEEVSVYGFTKDNTHRSAVQRKAFQKAVVEAVRHLSGLDAALLVIGDSSSPMFPKELLPYTERTVFGRGGMKVNLLVNYDWEWDIGEVREAAVKRPLPESIGSRGASRIDLVVRWGGRRRLSGFLPVQSVYADFYIVDALWPEFRPEQFYDALDWYARQDVTLGG